MYQHCYRYAAKALAMAPPSSRSPPPHGKRRCDEWAFRRCLSGPIASTHLQVRLAAAEAELCAAQQSNAALHEDLRRAQQQALALQGELRAAERDRWEVQGGK